MLGLILIFLHDICVHSSFSLLLQSYFTVWIYHNLFIHFILKWWIYSSLMNIWIVSRFRGTVNRAAEQVPVCIHVSYFSWVTIRSEIVGLCYKCMFKLIWNYQILSQSGCTSLNSHEQCMRVPLLQFPLTRDFVSLSYIIYVLYIINKNM